MKGLSLSHVGLCVLISQGCSFSNAPFFPTYAVDVDVTDPEASSGEPRMQGTFDRGSIEVITKVGACGVQVQLGQCKNNEQLWVMLKAQPNNSGGRGPECNPTVWERIKNNRGGSIPFGPSTDITRINEGLYVEVLAGLMEDTDGNDVIDKHTNENRIATRPLLMGRLTIYKATDADDPTIQGVTQHGEFLADIEAWGEGVGFVKGRIDGAVDAPDGEPVGPRCSWEVLSEEN